MKLWPFGKQQRENVDAIPASADVSAMDLLLTRNCNRDEFVLLYTKLLQERIPGIKVELPDDMVVRIVRPNGTEATAFLSNMWVSYSQLPDGRRELLERHIQALSADSEEGEPFAKGRLVATIKDTKFMESVPAAVPRVVEHLCGDLWVNFVEDLPDRMRSVKPEDLVAAGVSDAELREVAKMNLRKILSPPQRFGDGPWYMVAAGDYTASLLLFDRMWNEFTEVVDGDVVAIAPSRDVILVTGSKSEEGLLAIRARAKEILETGNYLISDTPLVWSGERWDVFNVN